MLAAHPDKAVRLSPKLAYLGGTQQPEPPSHEHGGLGMQRTPPSPLKSIDISYSGGVGGVGDTGEDSAHKRTMGTAGGAPTSHRRHGRKGFPRDSLKVPPLQHHGAHSGHPRGAVPPPLEHRYPKKGLPPPAP